MWYYVLLVMQVTLYRLHSLVFEVIYYNLACDLFTLVQWLKLSACKVGDRGNPALALMFQRNQIYLSCSLVNIQYCGEPPWPRSSEPGFKFRILCVWRAVPSHHHQVVLLVHISLYVHTGGLKPHSFHLYRHRRLCFLWFWLDCLFG